MAIDPGQKLEALKSELQQIVSNYNQAQEVVTNCERKILQLQGGIAACEDIVKPDEEEESTES